MSVIPRPETEDGTGSAGAEGRMAAAFESRSAEECPHPVEFREKRNA
jgi:hypothetical protein